MYCHATKFVQRHLRQVEESRQEFEVILSDSDCFHRKGAYGQLPVFGSRDIWTDAIHTVSCLYTRYMPLHQEPGQKPGQPGKAWPGQAFRVFGQAYRENAAW